MSLEVHPDFLVQRYGNGFKLLRPEQYQRFKGVKLPTVQKLFQQPFNVIFLDKDSIIQAINDNNAATFGCCSTQEAIGKTIGHIYQDYSASFSLQHDKQVIRKQQLIIEEEHCIRKDHAEFHTIVAKLPWYSSRNAVSGVIGISFAFGIKTNYSVQQALLAFNQLQFRPGREQTSIFEETFFSGQTIDGVHLSLRESQCINYLLQGKTAKMTANILNLSTRTIESYLNGIKNKLGVTTKAELFEKVLVSLQRGK